MHTLFELHPSFYLLMAAGIFWIIALVFYGKKESGGSLKEVINDGVNAEIAELKYKKYVRKMKIFRWIGITLALVSAIIALVPKFRLLWEQ